MKIAFDENVPAAMVRIFQHFQQERALRALVDGVTIERAQEYYPKRHDPDHSPKDDAPWIRRFSKSGGNVIVSGDTRMKSVPHERLALVEEKLVVIFFEKKWSGWKFCSKCSLLMYWWPTILQTAKKAKPGFYHVPCDWPADSKAQLRTVSTEDLKMNKILRQIQARDAVRQSRRRQRAQGTQFEMFDEKQEIQPQSKS